MTNKSPIAYKCIKPNIGFEVERIYYTWKMKCFLNEDASSCIMSDNWEFFINPSINPEFFEPVYEEEKMSVWDLKEGDTFYTAIDGKNASKLDWEDDDDCIGWRDIWDIFLTKEEAERELEYRKAKTKILRHWEENSGFVPDWRNGDQNKYYVLYRHDEKLLDYYDHYTWQSSNICHFRTYEEVEKSIEDCREEWLKIFNVK